MQKHLHDPKPKTKPNAKAKATSEAKTQTKPGSDPRSRAVTQNFDRDDALQRASEDAPTMEDTGAENAIEGEGSYTAGRRYDESVRQFVSSGAVEAGARNAQRAVDSPERKALAEAERIGKRGGRGPEPTRR